MFPDRFALLAFAPGRVELAEVDHELIGLRDVLVRTRTSLVSNGTELSYVNGTNQKGTFPCRLGQCLVGEVELVGPDVRKVQPGQTVIAFGQHASTVVVDDKLVFPLSAGVTEVEGLFCNALAQVRPATYLAVGDEIGVVGMGLFGQLASRLLVADGPVVVGSSRSPLRRKLASVPVVERLPEDSVDGALEMTGDRERIIEALEATRPGGTVVLFGHPRQEVALDLYRLVQRKGMTIVGVQLSVRSMILAGTPADHVKWAQHLVTGLGVEGLVTDIVSPADMPAMYGELAERDAKHLAVVIEWR